MNAMELFRYEDHEVRVVQGEDGEPRFVAADVCAALDLNNVTEALRGLDEDEKSIFRITDRAGREFPSPVITEAGLYSLVLRSRKPEAKRFKRWITHEVLPAIRKHGGYLTPQKVEEALLNPDVIIRLATDLKAEREHRLALAAKVEEDAPKVAFADAVSASTTSIMVGDLAKLLRQNGVVTGQHRLFEWMRQEGYLIKQRGESWNMPTQRAMEQGLFEVKERTVMVPDGSVRITRTVKVTGRGQQHFVNCLLPLALSTGCVKAI